MSQESGQYGQASLIPSKPFQASPEAAEATGLDEKAKLFKVRVWLPAAVTSASSVATQQASQTKPDPEGLDSRDRSLISMAKNGAYDDLIQIVLTDPDPGFRQAGFRRCGADRETESSRCPHPSRPLKALLQILDRMTGVP
jgi:hypothetical protein